MLHGSAHGGVGVGVVSLGQVSQFEGERGMRRLAGSGRGEGWAAIANSVLVARVLVGVAVSPGAAVTSAATMRQERGAVPGGLDA